MAVTQLNPYAPPFYGTCSHLVAHPSPPMPLYHHAGAHCPPPPYSLLPCAAAYYCRPRPFPFFPPRKPRRGYPMQLGSPSPSPAPGAVPGKRFVVRAAQPHGSAPHKLINADDTSVTAEKLREQAAAAASARAAADARQPARPASRWMPVGEVKVRRAGMAKEPYRPRRRQVPPRARAALESAFTTRAPRRPPPMEKLREGQTTVMVRNIPNRLTRWDMVRVLDDHCARVNSEQRRGRGGVASAYDLVYVRMDFRISREQRSSNMGYAFVNFTTPEAARRLQRSLHGRGWGEAFASRKIIEIAPATIQGKVALVRHFNRTFFDCESAEYLPAVFSPPRDGIAAASAMSTVGRRARVI